MVNKIDFTEVQQFILSLGLFKAMKAAERLPLEEQLAAAKNFVYWAGHRIEKECAITTGIQLREAVLVIKLYAPSALTPKSIELQLTKAFKKVKATQPK